MTVAAASNPRSAGGATAGWSDSTLSILCDGTESEVSGGRPVSVARCVE